jgi:pyruvate/2-oxoglutarate dehydrogenase complex dihydrolipoamide dehydrogenase (E3) component
VVIGAGAGGLVTAYIAAAVKAKVTLVESHKMGGDCLNYGCVPSKALIRPPSWCARCGTGATTAWPRPSGRWTSPQVMERVARRGADIEPHDSVERYTGLGVDVVQGQATHRRPLARGDRAPTAVSRR